MSRHIATATPPPSQSIRSSTNLGYVQYGCGWCAPKEWTNFDASLTLKGERLPILGRYTKNSQRFPGSARPGDIVKGLPVRDGSCQGVYASHVLEHLALEDFHKALGNTYHILGKGGIFRLVVPDMEWAARGYIARLDRGESSANTFFPRATNLGCESREPGFMGLARKLFALPHLWMWDESSMARALNDHGFRQFDAVVSAIARTRCFRSSRIAAGLKMQSEWRLDGSSCTPRRSISRSRTRRG